jgi:D-lactate dehydrogenase
MSPPNDHAFIRGLPAPYDRLYGDAATFIPASRLITDPLRLLTWGTDASFYRLVPKVAVVLESEDELVRLLALCTELHTPVTFRAAGTSLSGQAISDSVLVLLGDNWRGCTPGDGGKTITLQPGSPPRSFRPQDRPGPGVDRRCDDRRHRCQ